MKPFMRAQLERSVQRLSELDFLLSREDIMQDMTQFLVLSREHAEVMALVTPYQKWLQLGPVSQRVCGNPGWHWRR